MGGDANTVDVAAYDLKDEAEPFVAHHGPSLREIVDFGDLEQSRFIVASGESGNRVSPFYANLFERWRTVHSVPMQLRRDTVEQGATGTLRMTP